ncbi:hypothetical protein [Acetobacter oeni]|uniref:hypothetical protein n=1 Tax=Acetobacter oeni TaxID=304077 RepID=UPI001A7E1E52|nr:hypothetical protein [Acetobacter oeni]
MVSDFGNYKKGDLIENSTVISSITGSDQIKFVRYINLPKNNKIGISESKREL